MVSPRDGYRQLGSPTGLASKTVYLVADNTVVSTDGVSMILIGSDNTTATNRTFTLLTSPLVGHKLTLVWNTGSSTTGELADTGTMKIAGAWTPVQYDSIELISDGTNWIEVARGVTTGVLDVPLTEGQILVGNSSGLAADVAMSGDVTINSAGVTAIGATKVTAAMLATAISPSHVVKFAGTFTTAGGDASESITVTGAAATDIALVVLHTKGATPRTILTAQAATNAINVEMSGDPSTDHVLKYMVLRAIA